MHYVAFIVIVLTLATPLFAQGEDMAELDALMTRMPGTTLKSLERDSARFFEEAAGIVLGFGRDGAIGARGLEDAVAAARARVRARQMRRLLVADLDDDLRIDSRALDLAIRTASATMRGRITGWHMAADADANGRADFAEMRRWAQATALAEVSGADEKAITGLMIFDLDGDGRVSVPELRRAITLLGQPV